MERWRELQFHVFYGILFTTNDQRFELKTVFHRFRLTIGWAENKFNIASEFTWKQFFFFSSIDTFCSVATNLYSLTFWIDPVLYWFLPDGNRNWRRKKKLYIKQFMTLSLFLYATKCSKSGVGICVCESTHKNGWNEEKENKKKTKSPNSEWRLLCYAKTKRNLI